MVAVDLVEVAGTVLGHRQELVARDLAVVVAVGPGERGITTLALATFAFGTGLGAGAAFALTALAFALGSLGAATTFAFTTFALAGHLGRSQLVTLCQRFD